MNECVGCSGVEGAKCFTTKVLYTTCFCVRICLFDVCYLAFAAIRSNTERYGAIWGHMK